MHALGLSNARIALPNSVCFDVPLAVRIAGNIPVFVDIEPADLGIAIAQLERLTVDAVIAVHAYGSICKIDKIMDFCRQKQIPLIEDFAVAQGGQFAGSPVGSFGDISVVSFGSGKVVDVGHGGALLTNDQRLFSACQKQIARYRPIDRDARGRIDDLNRYHTTLYNERYGHGNFNYYCDEFLMEATKVSDDILVGFDIDYQERILFELDRLQESIDTRFNRYQSLSERLAAIGAPGLSVFKYADGSVPWRCNLFTQEYRDQLLGRLLSRGFKASSWHPSADLLFERRNTKSRNSPMSDNVGDTILNLWVNHEVSDDYTDAVANEIALFFDRVSDWQ